MPTFIKLTVNTDGGLGAPKDHGVPVDINFDHVVKITSDKSVPGMSKLVYTNGQTDRVYESRDLIERLLRGEKVGHYHEPGEPVPKDA